MLNNSFHCHLALADDKFSMMVISTLAEKSLNLEIQGSKISPLRYAPVEMTKLEALQPSQLAFSFLCKPDSSGNTFD